MPKSVGHGERVTREIQKVVEAIKAGFAGQELKAEMDALQHRKEALLAQPDGGPPNHRQKRNRYAPERFQRLLERWQQAGGFFEEAAQLGK